MKKRAQTPDSYTYTILLKGLAKQSDYPDIVGRALKIYHSMYAENSPVRPSIIHTNAALNVCAKAKDLDSLFGIAAKLPQQGPGAPDMYTFTTIINAVRNVTMQDGEIARDETTDEVRARRQHAVFQGRRMWGDIVERWKNGHLTIDESLVCSMGRLLLLGSMEQDNDDVLSLVEQTMRLQRQIPRLGDPARKTHLRGPKMSFENPFQPILEEGERDEDDLSRRDSEPLPSSEFDPLPPSKTSRIYAVPSRSTLSLLVDTCTRMGAIAAAQAYWGMLSAKFEPDQENYHTYLRLLRFSRSSTLATDLVKDMATPKEEGGLEVGTEPKTLRLAMSSCVRDANNLSSLKNGLRVYVVMQGALVTHDPTTVKMFSKLFRKKADWDLNLVRLAVEALWSSFINLRSMFTYGTWDDGKAVAEWKDKHAIHLPENEPSVEFKVDETRDLKSLKLGTRSELYDVARIILGDLDQVISIYGSQLSRLETRELEAKRHTLLAWTRRRHGAFFRKSDKKLDPS